MLEIPKWGCINVHASLLPRYRGAAPIHRAVMAGETVTGITTMQMDVGLDTGDMLLKAETPIGPDETYGEVHDRLSTLGAELLLETLAQIEQGTCPREPQDSTLATYAPPVRKEECQIDWTRPTAEIHDLVRGANPRPGAFTFRKGELLRVLRTRPLVTAEPGEPGQLFVVGGRVPAAWTGDGALELSLVQPAGKKPMPGTDYLLGRPINPGERLEG